MRRSLCVAALALLLLSPQPAAASQPLSLRDAYSFAIHYDTQFRSAEADREISKEEVSKAGAAFLPTVRGSLSRGRNRTQSQTPATNIFGQSYISSRDQYYNTISNGLTLKQPLFNLGNFASLKQAKTILAKSDLMLEHEHSNLIVRISEAYFNVLYSEDNLLFSRAQTKAAFEQLQQAKKRYGGGFGTVTEINEAQASYDMSIADEVSAINSLEAGRRELERITGVYSDNLQHLAPNQLLLVEPEPRNVEAWVGLARQGNPRLDASRKEIEVAGKEVDKYRVSRYPQVELWLGRNYSLSETNYSIGSAYDTWSISVQASVPIYTGGYTSASIRQAQARKTKAYDEMEQQERSIVSDIRKYYYAQLNGVAQVKAYAQAVKSHEIALEGTKKGFLAGFRTNADVLEAQKKLLESRRNLAKSRYQYLMSSLMLKYSAGTLSIADLEAVDGCLSGGGAGS
jgi:protease secretion system outer membrane protein